MIYMITVSRSADNIISKYTSVIDIMVLQVPVSEPVFYHGDRR